jgi:hypothetical protein
MYLTNTPRLIALPDGSNDTPRYRRTVLVEIEGETKFLVDHVADVLTGKIRSMCMFAEDAMDVLCFDSSGAAPPDLSPTIKIKDT